VNAARAGATGAIGCTCALLIAAFGTRTIALPTGCDCAKAAGATAVSALGARMLT